MTYAKDHVQAIRDQAEQDRKLVRFGDHSYVCGEWTASLFVVQGVQSIALYRGMERVGLFEKFEDAFWAAKSLREAA